MAKLFLTVMFLVLWLPALLFTSSNYSSQQPISSMTVLEGPVDWTFEQREYHFDGLDTQFFLYGRINGAEPRMPVSVQTNFMEWLFSMRRFNTRKQVFFTRDLPGGAYTSWLKAHDAGLNFSIGHIRFNWIFVLSLGFCIILPVLYLLMFFADDYQVETPEQRQRKDQNYVALVTAIEQRAQQDPKWLKRKTVALAFLGYTVILGSILLMLPVGIGTFVSLTLITGGHVGGIKLGFFLALIPLGFAWHMGKSLLNLGYEQSGVEVTRKQCPELFKMLDLISQKVKGPRFKYVYIDYDLNASVSRSRGLLGFFGMGPVVLTLGLPLMQSMTKKQLLGVIGHEYGHVAAKDNAWGQWVYRIRNSWMLLGEYLSLDTLWYTLKLNRFYAWFIAIFSAHSFALSRQCEYEADAFSARLVGKEVMAESLSAMVVFGFQYDDLFWKKIWDKNDKDIATMQPYASVTQFFSSLDDISATVEQALQQKTDCYATHPSVSDRLNALSQAFNQPQELGSKTAARLLGKLEPELIKQFDQQWRVAVQEEWNTRQAQRRESEKAYLDFTAKALRDLSDDQLGEFIAVCSELEKHEDFFQANEAYSMRHPNNAKAQLNCMWYLLIIKQDAGQLQKMEELLNHQPEMLPDVCHYAIEFLQNSGKQEACQSYHQRLQEWEYIRAAAADERDVIIANDEFLPHDCAPEEVAQFSHYCAEHPVLASVYLVRKVVQYMPEYPCFVVAYSTKASFWSSEQSINDKVALFVQQSNVANDFMFIELDSVSGMKAKLKKIPGSKIY